MRSRSFCRTCSATRAAAAIYSCGNERFIWTRRVDCVPVMRRPCRSIATGSAYAITLSPETYQAAAPARHGLALRSPPPNRRAVHHHRRDLAHLARALARQRLQRGKRAAAGPPLAIPSAVRAQSDSGMLCGKRNTLLGSWRRLISTSARGSEPRKEWQPPCRRATWPRPSGPRIL